MSDFDLDTSSLAVHVIVTNLRVHRYSAVQYSTVPEGSVRDGTHIRKLPLRRVMEYSKLLNVPDPPYDAGFGFPEQRKRLRSCTRAAYAMIISRFTAVTFHMSAMASQRPYRIEHLHRTV